MPAPVPTPPTEYEGSVFVRVKNNKKTPSVYDRGKEIL
jgi:hypothetical protein